MKIAKHKSQKAEKAMEKAVAEGDSVVEFDEHDANRGDDLDQWEEMSDDNDAEDTGEDTDEDTDEVDGNMVATGSGVQEPDQEEKDDDSDDEEEEEEPVKPKPVKPVSKQIYFQRTWQDWEEDVTPTLMRHPYHPIPKEGVHFKKLGGGMTSNADLQRDLRRFMDQQEQEERQAVQQLEERVVDL
jgi:hypothetical protein